MYERVKIQMTNGHSNGHAPPNGSPVISSPREIHKIRIQFLVEIQILSSGHVAI